MKKLNICIDIDGTITEPYYWLELLNKAFNKNVTEEEVTQYYIHKVMGVEQEDYESFYEKNKFKIHSEQKLREDVLEVLKELSFYHKLFFVTARDSSLEMLTHSYLRNNGVPFNDLFVLGSHFKVDKAKELSCNIFIEDNYENAIELSNNGFNVLLIDTNYNRKPINNNITRVYNWNEIYQFIKKSSLRREVI
ncbi:MAG: hypothetical protein AB6733_11845 [Clostridiaceae bacterium]